MSAAYFNPAEPTLRRSIQRKHGRPVYFSLEPVRYVSADGWSHMIAAGALTDWVSVPRLLTPLVPVDDKAGLCAMLHDDLLQRRGHGLSRAQVDERFYIALLEADVAPWRAKAMWLGVRWNAWTTGDR